MEATLIESANDAAFAVAEAVAGSEEAFLERMRAKAEELGLEDWAIYSPNGLPGKEGSSHDDRMTAFDLARVGAEVMEHPQLREWVGTDESTFRDGTFQLFSFNYLLRRYEPAEGIKTGFHRRSRFNLVGAARKGDLRLIAVVLGCERKGQLFARSEELFEEAFAQYRPVRVIERGQPIRAAVGVERGERSTVTVVAGDDVRVLAYRGRTPELQILVIGSQARAPVATGEPVGSLLVRRGGEVVGQTPVLAAAAVGELPWWRRAWQRFTAAMPFLA
jgi:D-alanyl-D-alanine carboxypeptidase (penicillin-binding protein 5/6)